MTRFTIALIAALALAAPAAANAASLAYVGPDGNVWLATPDGSYRKQLSSDATADSKYRSPSQLNDGRVVALRRPAGTSSSFAHFLRRSDGQVVDSWLLPKTGAGGFSPFTGAQASPDGGLITYDYRHFDCFTNPCQGWQAVGFVAGPGTTNPCLINCHVDYLAPRWLPGTPYAGMVDDTGQAVRVQNGGASPVGWFTYGSGIFIRSFDVRGGKIAVSATASDTEYLIIERMNGPAPNVPTSQCSVNLPAVEGGARPRLSPDGSMVAWATPEGVMVSPTPTQTGGTGTICQLTPTLVGPGGSQPDWGIVNLVKPADPDPNPGPGPGGDNAAPRASVAAVAGQRLRPTLRQGVKLRGSCDERCRMSVKLYLAPAVAKRFGFARKRTLVATGSGSGSGRFQFRAAFKSAAKSKLRRAGSVRFIVGGTARDNAGNSRALSGAFTLRR